MMIRKHSGFTLIELLVVIAIIAILAAILFPIFVTAKQSANTKKCLSNLCQLGRAFRMYADDWGKLPGGAPLAEPPVWGQWVWIQGTYPNNIILVKQGGLWPYVKNERVYICPSDFSQRRNVNGRIVFFGLSYSMNSNTCRQADGAFKRPSTTVLLIDEGGGTINPISHVVTPIADGFFGPGVDTPASIHGGGCNFLFVDGHAKWSNKQNFPKLNYNP